ncbi:alpha/beta hydrolase [Alkalibacterium olivapovliticus]|uniref:Carboxylesterase n=1 Tax=Alkalibacterium olivapovliticus TaxID=99907 RepID=A0A2T0W7E5_9LACT|nr:alpha/beta fold hydrolase [Alkalibacterium olivapovliticus]PRY82631.1 carboxylesterase [Alkalibacterium olivapovliticus]
MKAKSLFYESGKRAVLLFHAFTSNPKDMLSLGRALERADYTVYAPVFSGHGTSDPDDLFDYTIEDWVKDGKEALAFLKEKGYEEIAVMGLSLGGIVATHLLLNEEVMGGGIFASPVISDFDTNVPDNFMVWYESMKENEGYARDEIAGLKTTAEVKVRVILDSIHNHVSEMEKEYDSISKKVFIAQGGKDEMINDQSAVAFRDALTNAEVSFHWYEDAPHVLTTGKIGKEVQIDVLTYLSTLEWSD